MEPRANRSRTGITFSKDIRSLLYAFGDTSDPLDETIALFDDALIDFIQDMALRASVPASHAGRSKVKLDDLFWAAREQPAMIGRARDILKQEKIIAKQRKITTEDQEARALAVAETRRTARKNFKAKNGAGTARSEGGTVGAGRRRKRKAAVAEMDGADDEDDAESVTVPASSNGRKRARKSTGPVDAAGDDSDSV